MSEEFIQQCIDKRKIVIQKSKDGNRHKKIYCYNPDGTLYQVFKSAMEGLRHFGKGDKGGAAITQSIKNKCKCCGKYWVYEIDIHKINEIKIGWKLKVEMSKEESKEKYNERKRREWKIRKERELSII